MSNRKSRRRRSHLSMRQSEKSAIPGAMKTSWLALSLAAACGGATSPAGPAATPATPPAAPIAPAPTAEPDPHLAARRAHVSVGGKWMPRQILDHADTLRRLGLAIDPARLADPLSPVLGAVV